MDEQQVRPWWGNRVVFEFPFPPKIAAECGHSKVGIVAPGLEEELQALEAGKTMLDGAYKLDAMSIATIDGHPVQQNGSEAQRLIADPCPKVRSLINQGRRSISTPEDDECTFFLKGVQRVAG